MTSFHLAALLLATFLVGCAPYHKCDGAETYCVDGVPFELRDLPEEFYGSSLIEARLGAQLGVSLAYWGVPRSDLDGWRVVYQRGLIECAHLAAGCFDPTDRTITLTTYLTAPGCIEAAALPHEIGHFVEASHANARWSDFAAPWRELLAQPECAALEHAEPWASPLYLWFGEAARASWYAQ